MDSTGFLYGFMRCDYVFLTFSLRFLSRSVSAVRLNTNESIASAAHSSANTPVPINIKNSIELPLVYVVKASS